MTIRSSSLIGLLIWVTASLWPSPVSAQVPACEPGGPDVTNSSILAPVIYLTLPSFDGRGFGTVGDWCASEYVAAQFETLGLKPGANGSFFQIVPDPHSSDAPSMARNAVAVIEGSDPVLRNEVILVAAHHDHLSPDTAPDGTPRHYAGADDNASGVSALLFAAKLLADGPRPKRTIMFATFTGEEVMFRGADHFADNPPIPLAQITGMLNIDMVGRLYDGALQISGTGTSAEWPALIGQTQADLPAEQAESPRRGSDHLVFHRRGIPVLYLNTGTHVDHHEPTDLWQRVDQHGLDRIAHFVARLIGAAASHPSSLTLGEADKQVGQY